MLISSGAARTCSFSSPCDAVRSRFNSAPGASLQPPPWRSLAISMTPRAVSSLDLVVGQRRVEALLFALRLAVGGVGEHVDADRQRVGDVLDDGRRIVVPLAGLGELPVAGQVLVAVDDASAAAVFDAPQLAGVGRIGPHHVLHPPDRMAGRDRLQFVFRFGKDGAINWRKPASKRLESLQQASAKMKPPRST